MAFELLANVAAAANKKYIFLQIKELQEMSCFLFVCFFSKIVPEPHVAVLTDGPFVVRVGQGLLAQGAALREGLLIHLFPDVAN